MKRTALCGSGAIHTLISIFSLLGLTPAIGAYLDYAPDIKTNISYMTIWSTKIKEYVNTICETKVGCIFGANGTVEDYHVYEE
jgi:hypothetical protein